MVRDDGTCDACSALFMSTTEADDARAEREEVEARDPCDNVDDVLRTLERVR
jgi:hypothetical protein